MSRLLVAPGKALLQGAPTLWEARLGPIFIATGVALFFPWVAQNRRAELSGELAYTAYFLATRERADRASIALEWIERTVSAPSDRHVQDDGRVRCWARIPEAGDRWLRVVVLPDGVTVHNAFFDRRFEP